MSPAGPGLPRSEAAGWLLWTGSGTSTGGKRSGSPVSTWVDRPQPYDNPTLNQGTPATTINPLAPPSPPSSARAEASCCRSRLCSRPRLGRGSARPKAMPTSSSAARGRQDLQPRAPPALMTPATTSYRGPSRRHFFSSSVIEAQIPVVFLIQPMVENTRTLHELKHRAKSLTAISPTQSSHSTGHQPVGLRLRPWQHTRIHAAVLSGIGGRQHRPSPCRDQGTNRCLSCEHPR